MNSVNRESAPTVSIGLPVYNGAEFLEETIRSLLAQTYANFELIISDNASTDRTEEICRAYIHRDKRLRYFRQTENIGGPQNFNFLFSVARGKYFKWAAADDLLKPEYLDRCIAVLDKRPEFVLCHTRTMTIDHLGNDLPNGIIRSSGGAENPDNPTPGFERAWYRFRSVLLGNGNPVHDTAVVDFYGVIRADKLKNTGLLEPYVGYEKIVMSALALQGRLAEIGQPLFSYRLHPNSVSNQNSLVARREWSDPLKRSSSYPRFQYLKGYILTLSRLAPTVRDRAHCIIVVVQYVFQIRKWRRVLMEGLFGRGIGDGNIEILRINGIETSSSETKSGI